MIELASIRAIYLYPVKAMRGIAVNEARLGLNGLQDDRRYAYVRQDLAPTDGFPWATGRDQPRMILYTPCFVSPSTSDASAGVEVEPRVLVHTPDGEEFEVGDPRLTQAIAREQGQPVWLLKSKRGNFDSQHLSLFSLATLQHLERECGTPIDPRQFRANLYIEPYEGLPFLEDEWVGRILRIGESAVAGVTKKDSRCMMINLDPDTARQNPAVLRTVTQKHSECAGVYANVIAPGIVRVGDSIRMI